MGVPSEHARAGRGGGFAASRGESRHRQGAPRTLGDAPGASPSVRVPGAQSFWSNGHSTAEERFGRVELNAEAKKEVKDVSRW